VGVNTPPPGCAPGVWQHVVVWQVWDSESSLLRCEHNDGNVGVVGLANDGCRLVVARIDGRLDFFVVESAKSAEKAAVQYRGWCAVQEFVGWLLDPRCVVLLSAPDTDLRPR